MSLPHLVFDFVPLLALRLIDLQRLVVVVGAAMFLGEIINRLLDEREVYPDLSLDHIYMY